MAAWDSFNSAPPPTAPTRRTMIEHRPAAQRRHGRRQRFRRRWTTPAALRVATLRIQTKNGRLTGGRCLMLPPCRTNAAIQPMAPTRRQHVSTSCDLSALGDFDSHGLKTQFNASYVPKCFLWVTSGNHARAKPYPANPSEPTHGWTMRASVMGPEAEIAMLQTRKVTSLCAQAVLPTFGQ